MGRSRPAPQRRYSEKGEKKKEDRGPNIPIPNEDLTADSVYEFYAENLFPAIWASLPLLLLRVGTDLKELASRASTKTLHFLLPWFQDEQYLEWKSPFSAIDGSNSKLVALWENAISGTSNSSLAEFLMRHFDADNDGHISAAELLKMNEALIPALTTYSHPQTWVSWFNRTWPLMDWKLGVFLWRSCGGLMLLIVFCTIIPGRLHEFSGRLLRWPILGLTYFMISVELVVYVMIRLFIRLVETIFANSKHRSLRRQMAQAKSYDEWYEIARALDVSQGRDKWQEEIHDDSFYRYNWSFIKELMNDMRDARQRNDSVLALAVLQQCTRKNVGGVMSEEQFSFTNTGEPKHIVQEFIKEVVVTLHWVAEEASKIPRDSPPVQTDKLEYEERLRKKSLQEKNKMWGSLISWATLSFGVEKEKPARMKTVNSDGALVSSRPIKSSSSVPALVSSSSTDSQSSASSPAILPTIHRENVITFLKRARAAYGRTALCLSGGAMMGNYHFGHIKALLEEDCLPYIISGTSAGSAIAAMVCTRTEEELNRDMVPEMLTDKLKCFSRSWPDRIRTLIKGGHMFETQEWIDMIKWFTCGDLTFEEAYKKTGRVFCITLSATTKKAPPVLLNHVSAPNVVIASAVVASAAVPGFIPPVMLQVKDSNGIVRDQSANKDQLYWDGSIEQDIPTSGLAEMLNCQFFLAAQCNPHIVPFFYNTKGAVGQPSRWSSGKQLHSWRGGFLLSALEKYLKLDMKAKFHFLNDLEAAVGFTSTLMTQQYEGTTTIVPRVQLIDYFKLFRNQNLSDLYRYFQGGSVAAYRHCAMIKSHYSVVHALDDCLARLELQDGVTSLKPRRRIQILAQQLKSLDQLDGRAPRRNSWGYGDSESEFDDSTCDDDEYERGFDGVEIAYTSSRKKTYPGPGVNGGIDGIFKP